MNKNLPVSVSQIMSIEAQVRILTADEAKPEEVAQLLAYNDNVFDHTNLTHTFPLEPDPYVTAWET